MGFFVLLGHKGKTVSDIWWQFGDISRAATTAAHFLSKTKSVFKKFICIYLLFVTTKQKSCNRGQFGSYRILPKLKLRDVNILLLASLYKHQFLNKMFRETFFEEHTEHCSLCHFKWLKLLKILYFILLTLSKYMNNCLCLKYF